MMKLNKEDYRAANADNLTCNIMNRYTINDNENVQIIIINYTHNLSKCKLYNQSEINLMPMGGRPTRGLAGLLCGLE